MSRYELPIQTSTNSWFSFDTAGNEDITFRDAVERLNIAEEAVEWCFGKSLCEIIEEFERCTQKKENQK